MNTPPKPTEIAKPCPFCGTTEIEGPFPINRAAEWFVLRCGNPGCQAEIEAREAHEALTLWNRRPAPETQAPVESAPALAPFEKLADEFENKGAESEKEAGRVSGNGFPCEAERIRGRAAALYWCSLRLSAVVEEVRGKEDLAYKK